MRIFILTSIITLFFTSYWTQEGYGYGNGLSKDPDEFLYSYRKFRFKEGLAEAFAGEFLFSLEYRFGNKLWVELGGGPTSLLFGQMHLTSRERFFDNTEANLSFDSRYQRNYKKMGRFGAVYTIGYSEYGNAYFGGELDYKEFSYDMQLYQDGKDSSRYSGESLELMNQFIGVRAKIGYCLHWEMGETNKKGKMFVLGLDFSIGTGLAHLDVLRYDEMRTYDPITEIYSYQYLENRKSYFRNSTYLSVKIFQLF